MLRCEVIRKKLSYDYRYSKEEIIEKSLNEYQANTKNNMRDILKLIEIKSGIEVFVCNNTQTIANHPRMKFSDTINTGKFKIKCFVDQRNFNTPIHGIIEAYDLHDQYIDEYSMQEDGGQYIGRFLIHSSYYRPLERDTRAYSGGCLIMSTKDILKFNDVIKDFGYYRNKEIPGILKEV